jgi:TetR/AcrR family transcriptional repressor of nem operon
MGGSPRFLLPAYLDDCYHLSVKLNFVPGKTMRRSAEEKAETRRQIVKTAGRMIRGKGLAETGVAEVMAEAGLTHGGFYRHFASKEDLAAAAVEEAFASMRAHLKSLAEKAAPGQAMVAVIDAYLTKAHRDRPEHGCVMASVGTEAYRAGGPVQTAYQTGIVRLAGLFADLITAPSRREAEDRAQVMLSVLVGGLLLARALKHNPAESQRALANARTAAHALLT